MLQYQINTILISRRRSLQDVQHPHSICLIPNECYSALYQKVNRYLSEGYAVIYGLEPSPVDKVIQNMANSRITVDDHIESGALTVLDRNSIYSMQKTHFEGEALLGVWFNVVSEVRRKGEFKGIAAMGMPEPFFETKNHDKLIAYEQLVSKQQFDGNLEAICCYSQTSIKDHLTLGQLIFLLSSHQYSVADTFGYNEWHATRVIEWANRGLERMLGRANSRLAFEAMKYLYKIDEGFVVSQPEILEKAIKKMFVDSAEIIIDSIKDEIIKEILFTHSDNLAKPKDNGTKDI